MQTRINKINNIAKNEAYENIYMLDLGYDFTLVDNIAIESLGTEPKNLRRLRYRYIMS